MSDKNRRVERFHYGICLNDECSKCRKKEIQQIPLRKELICEECGKPLRECTPPAKTATTKYIVLGVMVVVIGIVGVFLLNDNKKTEPTQQLPDKALTSIIQNDTDQTEQVVIAENKDTFSNDTIIVSKEIEPAEIVTSSIYNIEFGSYEGPMKNGKPHGFGGAVKVTRSYSIDLKKIPSEYLKVEKGDVIVSTKFTDGVLRAGELHRKDGSRKVFTI